MSGSIVNFFTNKEIFMHYIFRNARGVGNEHLGRLDIMLFTIMLMKSKFTVFFFGHGIGNLSLPLFSSMAGEYISLLKYGIQELTFSHIILEAGVLGFLVYLVFWAFIFIDSYSVSKQKDGLFSILALGWLAVVMIFTISLFYKNILHHSFLYLSFWYFSGVVVSRSHFIKKNTLKTME
jgi:hypothetical protein